MTPSAEDTFNFGILPRAGYCQADYANAYVVDPAGGLFKCTVSFQPELKVGQIQDDGKATFNLDRLSLWLGKDPFHTKECAACKVLPLCMGGCRSSTLKAANKNKGCASPVLSGEIKSLLTMLFSAGIYRNQETQ